MRTICFDIDDTILLWNIEKYPQLPSVFINTGTPGSYVSMRELKINNKMIDRLKEHKRIGDYIIVWTSGGKEWADEVVHTLNLKDFVDVTMGKPDKYYDDLPHDEFMPYQRDYVEP